MKSKKGLSEWQINDLKRRIEDRKEAIKSCYQVYQTAKYQWEADIKHFEAMLAGTEDYQMERKGY